MTEVKIMGIEFTPEDARKVYLELEQLFGGKSYPPSVPHQPYPYPDCPVITCGGT